MPDYFAQENIRIETPAGTKDIAKGDKVLTLEAPFDLQTILSLAQVGRIGDVAPKADAKVEPINTIAATPAEVVIPKSKPGPKADAKTA